VPSSVHVDQPTVLDSTKSVSSGAEPKPVTAEQKEIQEDAHALRESSKVVSVKQQTKTEINQQARAHRYYHSLEPRLIDYRGRSCTYEAKNLAYILRVLISIILRWTTLWVVIISVAGTFVCWYFNVATDMPLTILAIGVVFPVSFTISFEVNRRERVLLDVASLKASSLGLYWHCREWPAVQADKDLFSEAMRQALDELLKEISLYLTHRHADIYLIYAKFDEVNHIVENLRRREDWIRSVVSRLYQYVRYMLNDFERLRTVTDFRTPAAFRAYTWFWLTFFPLLFSPYFAFIAKSNLWAGLYDSIVTSLMLVSLYNAVVNLEDPFDGDGMDDLNMDMVREPSYFMFHRTETDMKVMKKLEKKQDKREMKALLKQHRSPKSQRRLETLQAKDSESHSTSEPTTKGEKADVVEKQKKADDDSSGQKVHPRRVESEKRQKEAEKDAQKQEKRRQEKIITAAENAGDDDD